VVDPGRQTGYLLPILLGSLPFAFLNFGLPVYVRSLGADAVAIGGMYTAFTATMLVARPLVGWALDRFGRRWFFTFAFLFYTLAMATFSQATEVFDFYVARFVQGLGASLMWVSARTIVGDVSLAAERGREMGRLTARSVRGSMAGAFYGFTLLGMMPIAEAWVIAFLGYAAAAALGFLVSVFRLPETKVVRTSTGPMPRVQLSPPLVKLLVIVFLSGFASALIEPIYLIFLQDKFDLPLVVLAMAFFPSGIVFAILPQYAGQLGDRFGKAPIITLGIAAAALVSAALPWLPHILFVAVLYTLFSAGWAMASPNEDALLTDMTDDYTRGRIFGYREAAAGIGAALGPLAGGALYEYVAVELAFVANGGLLLVTAFLVWTWFQQKPETR
jgi:DHA1 family multidrug resistance protein-like MFS transporter